MAKLLDVTKTVTTIDGRPARFVTKIAGDLYCYVFVITHEETLEYVVCTDEYGSANPLRINSKPSENNIINMKTKVKGWINVFVCSGNKHIVFGPYASEKEARTKVSGDEYYIGTFPFEYEV